MWMVLLSAALAAPTWSWDAPRRLLVELKVQTPYVMWLMEDRNGSARVSYVALAAVMRCTPDETLKKDKGWVIGCTVDDASFYTLPLLGDEGRAEEAVRDYEAILEATALHFRLTPDGHVSQLRLDEPPHRTERNRYIHDMQERYLELALAPVDTWLPGEGVTPGDTYTQRSFKPGEMPIRESAMGSLKAQQRVVAVDGGDATLEGLASGAIVVGTDSWKLHYQARSSFADGQLTHSEVDLNTSANSNSIGPNQISYRLWARTRALGDDEVVQLVPSQEF